MRNTLLFGLIAATVSLPALASHDDRDDNYEDRARVISVAPQYERVNSPRQECRTEYVRESYYEAPQRSLGGAVIGGVTGGLLGSTIGRGNGRVAAAAVGAGVGAIVGDRVDNDRGYGNRGRERVETRPVERCETVDNWQNIPAGYLVNYEYNGRQYSTVTDRDPGRFIPVNVSVRSGGYVSQVSYREGRGERRGWKRGHGYGHRKHHDRDYW
ncbi:MAG TPA: glycine zipper 2TM domain-containing protein [Methylotenera sp.]|nr:glycine zipper 2TM domain-containing protein [Methylotenera sp.]HPV45405.1 glycine zipper 2TM domain-containing protein [Methylotenera sp.]